MEKLKIFIFGKDFSIITHENYRNAVEQSGFEACYDLEPDEAALKCDALLLPGGSDLNPLLYGEENEKCIDIDDERDKGEYLYLDAFSKANKPIFGICRGIQAINVFFGGSLYQDIGDDIAPLHKNNIHKLNLTENSFLKEVYKDGLISNSSHHQGIKRIAEGFMVSALSDENVIEAFENREKNIYAVQFHPERMTCKHLSDEYSDGKNFFDFIYNVTLKYKNKEA